MVMARIFKIKSKEEGRREERELALRADKERQEGETLAQAMERLRLDQRS